MPKTKRSQIVHLSQAKKKTKQDRESLLERIQEAFDAYSFVYLIKVENIRNSFLKQLRDDLREDSKIFFGRVTLMTKALMLNATDADDGLEQFCQHITGSNTGLVFSNRTPKEFKVYCDELIQQDYARAGFHVSETVVIPKGAIMKGDKTGPMSHTFENQLRANGMPALLKKGVLVLDDDYVICTEGDTLNANQAKLLKIFDYQLADSRIVPLMCYTDGQVSSLELV
jgi:mRNA turnover protein 4